MEKISKSVTMFIVFLCILSATMSNSIPNLQAQSQFVQPQDPLHIKPKQTIQQFQISVVVPPGAQPPAQGVQPPGASSPEYVWLQVPASYFTSQSPPLPSVEPTQRPAIVQPIRPATPPYFPPAQQTVPATSQSPPIIPVETLLKKCLKPRGQFPSDTCNKYVNCWDGVAVEQFCPEGLVFNAKGYCDYPVSVNCGGRPIEAIPPPPIEITTSGPGQTSSQAPTTAAPPTVIVTLPTIDPALRKRCLKPRGQFRSQSCNKYVNCWDDVVIEQECPEGLLFSNKGYCDYAANVDCNNATLPHRSGNQQNVECPLDSGTFREKSNCSNYYTCISGNVVARYSCPEGFSFNDVGSVQEVGNKFDQRALLPSNIGVCDYSERVDCTKEPLLFSPKTNFLSTIPKDFMQKVDQCKPGSVFALNPQCTAACLCHDGVSEVVQCPSGLAYDSQTDKCLLPQLAKC